MPHIIDIDGMYEELFVLSNLCYASPHFCKSHDIGRLCEEKEYDWHYYFGHLKALVSKTLIHCSISLRVLQDFLKNNEDVDFASLDNDARDSLVLGVFTRGSGNLTLREACNKIIHAIEFTLSWQDLEVNASGETPEFWDGKVILQGERDGKEWQIHLNVLSFCTATHRFLKALEDDVDWYHLYKHDR